MNRNAGKGSLPRPLSVSVMTYHTNYENTFNKSIPSGSLNTRDVEDTE